jgi:hypothetical protein
MAIPVIRIVPSIEGSGSVHLVLRDLLSRYRAYIPGPRDRKLNKHRITGQDILHHQTCTGEKIESGKQPNFTWPEEWFPDV